LESPLNVRNSATVAGALVSCDGRSPFATALLALDAKITVISNQLSVISSQSSIINVGDFLPLRPRGLITQIVISLNVKFSFEYVSRSPMDKPIVCVALTQWKSGRTRLALGGYGESPLLALDGIDADSIGSAQAAVRNAYREAADDWASSEYRMDVAATLAKRCLAA
jgi:CO/xanthine dehydrogenase FAD-binding subunit